VATPDPGYAPGRAPKPGRIQIGSYFSVLTLATTLGHPDGLLRLPIQFWLKDDLGTSPQGLALFDAAACAPVYLAFLFGILRDHRRPIRAKDRGYLIFSAVVAI
jgi:hypothetical protein